MLDFDGDQNDDFEFKINHKYAEKYEIRKKKEELTNLKARYEDEDSESTEEEEDEDGILVTPQVDAKIMSTIAMIQAKDPKVYDQSQVFFDEELEKPKTEAQPKPFKLKDYHRENLLNPKEEEMTHVEEQANVKQEFVQAVQEIDEEEDFLTVRKPTKEELEKEEKEYSQFLIQNVLKEVPNQKLVEEWKTKSDPNEAFLMDYVLNQRWKEAKKGRVPTYEEIVKEHHDETDEEEVEAAEAFEASYNFRFEDPDATTVLTHARDIPNTLRRKDTTRAEKRKEKKQMKKLEKSKKEEELKRLKNLKREEIKQKLDQIKKLAGGDVGTIYEEDLEKDFDPEEYDAKMQAAFDDDYYQAEDPLKKPVFEDDIDDIIAPKTEKSLMEDDELFELVGQEKKEELKKSIEEYYKLDHEDIIGDMPVRFRYKKVEAEDFGIKPDELLQADDADLNQVISLKKLAPYRSEQKKQKDAMKWKASKKKKLWEFRSKLKGKKIHDQQPEEEQVQGNKRLKIDASRMEAYLNKKKKK
ncbi:KRI1-like family C-terminal-domain-containing protein [Gorgonomyces haynaldii]|nr:KRI1-like family C-terminal-domain-containing protein [Gorgonomyces haynaldii]